MISLGSDHGGYELKAAIIKHLEERKIEYKDYGTYSTDSCDYAVFAEKTAKELNTQGYCVKYVYNDASEPDTFVSMVHEVVEKEGSLNYN